MKKLFLCLLMLLCSAAIAVAEEAEVQTYTEGAYEYILTEDGAVITDYLWSDTLPDVIEVPVSLGGMPVVGFEYVFASGDWRQHDVKIVIPEGITTIGNAFVECTEVTESVLPASLEHIPEDAFTWVSAEILLHPDNPHFVNENGFLIDQLTNTLLYTAPSAANLPLPEVSRLGDHCLWNWHPSECVVLPESLTSIGRGVFDEWMDTTSIIIPDSVTEIGAGAFNCAGLTSIDLPDGLTSIPDLMLSCSYITEITIPEGVKSIGSWAFYLCPLTRVEIPATCTFVALDAFDPEVELIFHGEGQLETENEYAERTGHNYWMDDEDEQAEPETHTDGIYEYTLTDEGAVLTRWKWYTDGYVLPEVVELPAELGGQPVVGIGHNALNTSEMDYEDTFTLIVPEGVKWLDKVAFQCCHNADVIHIPASLTEIPEACFHHVWAEMVVADSNPRYVIQSGYLIDTQTDTLLYATSRSDGNPIPVVRRIGAGSMCNWVTKLGQELVIPEGVEEIGEYAFYDWEFSRVTLPESLRLIESNAFDIVITEPVILPAGVEIVQNWAFSGCGSEVEVIATSDATHFETADEYEARTGYRHWMDDWAEE